MMANIYLDHICNIQISPTPLLELPKKRMCLPSKKRSSLKGLDAAAAMLNITRMKSSLCFAY
jgi:hypothetical protein